MKASSTRLPSKQSPLKLLQFGVGVICCALLSQPWMAHANEVSALMQMPLLSHSLAQANQVTATGTTGISNDTKIDLRKLLISRSHYQDSEINLEIGLHQISLSIVNSRSNEISKKLRMKDAVALASIIERAIKSDHQFSDINAIHINYLQISGEKTKIIQAFDFYQTSAGFFVLNQS
jgi:hypothetical protein